ncbi:MAG: ABC transporter ATP-binding protein [Acidimicrobiales bacterium]|nr:ABC transporter ATP-binding protein [Acidimicrobiales bacterium]MDG1845295.1 ABC transporter ATP-binding protein [Acidimicrobiales bacterium]
MTTAGLTDPVVPSATSKNLFQLQDVYRIYGEEPVAVHALDGVSVEINSGDFMAIIGPSGSGKSTLLGLLGCLDLPTRGSIKVSGTEVTTLEDSQRSKLRGDTIGFVFQQFHLIPHLTAMGNVATALLYRNMTKAERKDQAMEALTKVGLAERHDHRPVQMSGGEQQRVALARAIVTDPLMILADEPTGALDTKNAAMVMEIFKDLQGENRAIVVVTHDLEIAEQMDRVVSMRDGKIISDDLNRERTESLQDQFWESGGGTKLE